MVSAVIKFLLNCSTLVKGGALQAAVSFIRTAIDQNDAIKWHHVLSKPVYAELQQLNLLSKLEFTTVIERSPAKSYVSRRELKRLEGEVRPDVIFTLFGPAYVNFEAPHLCGVADGWVTHGDRWAWRTVQGPVDAIRMLGTILYKAFMYRRADAWVTESAIAKEGLVRRVRIKGNRVAVVPNSCASHYLSSEAIGEGPSSDGKVRILCMSAYYRHKNLEIVPDVAKEIEALLPDLQFEFVMTLPVEGEGIRVIMLKAKALGVAHRIVNVGYVPLSQGPELYRASHLLFLPSVLETFSANYPEAMAMGKPIVTTNLGFARDVCKKAALYFEPMNAKAAANAIVSLCRNAELWQSLIAEGKRALRDLPTQDMKYEMYKNCIYALHRRCVVKGLRLHE